MNKSKLVELKYQSLAAHDLGILDLTKIIDVAIATNTRLGITGVLFFDKGHFGQILEGKREDVEEVWSKIQKDPRHFNIEFLGISEIEERRFPNWAMKLFDVQEFSLAFPSFSDVVDKMADQDLEALRTLGKLWSKL